MKPVRAAPRAIDRKEAVQIAEQFVRDNGHSDFVPTDLAALQPEGIEYGDRTHWIAMRVNTLRPTAQGVRRGASYDPKGWTVGFAYIEPRKDLNIGRAVTMNEFGEHLKMQHQCFKLNFLDSGDR
jgi:hypothetical protein